MEATLLKTSQKLVEDLSKGVIGHEIESRNLVGLQIMHVKKGFLRCNFTVTECVSGEDGNWHVGAMATLIDNVGAFATHTLAGQKKATVHFSVSYYSTAKIQEEVELEAKVVGEKGSLTSVLVEVRRKDNGELIALGKQWMTSNKIVASIVSKL